MFVRPEVAAPVLILAAAYPVGGWQLQRRGGEVSAWRLAATASGLPSLVVALSYPVDLTMSREAWYRTYPNADDQSLGGLIMFGLGGAVDMLAVLILIARYLAAQDQAPPAATGDGEGESRQIAARWVSGRNA